jgi:hypothetical protein
VIKQFPVVSLYVLSTNFLQKGRLKFDFTTVNLTAMMNGSLIFRPRHIFFATTHSQGLGFVGSVRGVREKKNTYRIFEEKSERKNINVRR